MASFSGVTPDWAGTSNRESLRTIITSFHSRYALPVTEITVSKHWRKRKVLTSNQPKLPPGPHLFLTHQLRPQHYWLYNYSFCPQKTEKRRHAQNNVTKYFKTKVKRGRHDQQDWKNGENKHHTNVTSEWKEYLDKVIYDTHWQNDNEKHWRAVADNRNGSHDTERANNPGVKTPGQLGVNNVDVFRESVNNAADRRAVEKWHWRPESALEDGGVENGGWTQYSLGQSEGTQQHKDPCWSNTSKHIPSSSRFRYRMWYRRCCSLGKVHKRCLVFSRQPTVNLLNDHFDSVHSKDLIAAST